MLLKIFTFTRRSNPIRGIVANREAIPNIAIFEESSPV